MSKLSNTLAFVLGAATGSFVAQLMLKNKYERRAREEIDSVKEMFSSRQAEPIKGEKTKTEDEAEKDEDGDATELFNIIHQYRSSLDGEEEKNNMIKPYVIPPEEYGSLGYKCVSLTYFEDGVVADDRDNVFANADEIIGEDFADHYGEYEDDSVFIRNDKLKRDYEILRDRGTFAELMEPETSGDAEG